MEQIWIHYLNIFLNIHCLAFDLLEFPRTSWGEVIVQCELNVC